MKLCILYHPKSEHARKVEEFAHDFKRQKDRDIELLSLETREGSAIASIYDIVQYPALLAMQDNGQLLKNWEGEELPLMNEVAAYTTA